MLTSSQRIGLRHVLLMPGVRSVLTVVMTWMLAHNILYTHIAPFVAPAGLANELDLVLLVLLLAGSWIVYSARSHGFPHGQRQTGAVVIGH